MSRMVPDSGTNSSSTVVQSSATSMVTSPTRPEVSPVSLIRHSPSTSSPAEHGKSRQSGWLKPPSKDPPQDGHV
jgi:hypothetical protein